MSAGVFGNNTRNSLRGPGFATLDFTLQRRLTFTQRFAAALRWDVFNVLNRANFGNPVTDITGVTAGTITSLAGDPRVMQFSVRLFF